ncbi:MAG: hypothetical protein U0990_10490 [Candidatus Nanopelagicales bacterium]|nr:hypothetical protein [Candidatus Nanopelagicales bacterium]MDZ4250502.1 hypothetical protein [Candidatus Nanopelagicales bacterium]
MGEQTVECSISCEVPVHVLGRFCQDVAAEAEWVPMLEKFELLESDDEGRVMRGMLSSSILGMVKETYEMHYWYEPNVMHYKLPNPSKLQKVQEGTYSAIDNGDGTSTFEIFLRTDNSAPAPGFVKKKAAEKVQDMIMSAAKKFVEANRARYEA